MSTYINLISGPRNVSTALMYSFAQRENCKVYDEPFYGVYLNEHGFNHPGRKEILASMDNDFNSVLNTLKKDSSSEIFIKGMAHHFRATPMSWILGMKNVFLLREPRYVISSFIKQIEKPNIGDLGYKNAYEIKSFLDRNQEDYILIDSDEIVDNPETALKRLCEFCEIEFTDRMLEWKAGAIEEDGLWAKFWYKNVHKSTGFAKVERKAPEIPKRLHALLEECEKFYQLLKS